MRVQDKVVNRYKELSDNVKNIRSITDSKGIHVQKADWSMWSVSALHLINLTLGPQSVHAQRLKAICDNWKGSHEDLGAAHGIFIAAYNDYYKGFSRNLSVSLTGELFSDFVLLAKRCLKEGNKDVAAVIACAALEDCLKKYAAQNGLDVKDKNMQEVVSALKAKKLVAGAQKTLLDTMPKIRDYAMHANWDKIHPEDVNSVIGFVEQFLVSHF